MVTSAVRGRLVRRSERRPSSEADFIESGERVQRAERVQNEFSAEAVRGPHGRFGGVRGLRRASQAVWRRPSSAAASTFGPIAAKGGKTMDVEGPRARAYGVSRRSAEGVRAISWGSQSALLDSLFDDRPALLDYDAGALRVVGGFM